MRGKEKKNNKRDRIKYIKDIDVLKDIITNYNLCFISFFPLLFFIRPCWETIAWGCWGSWVAGVGKEKVVCFG